MNHWKALLIIISVMLVGRGAMGQSAPLIQHYIINADYSSIAKNVLIHEDHLYFSSSSVVPDEAGFDVIESTLSKISFTGEVEWHQTLIADSVRYADTFGEGFFALDDSTLLLSCSYFLEPITAKNAIMQISAGDGAFTPIVPLDTNSTRRVVKDLYASSYGEYLLEASHRIVPESGFPATIRKVQFDGTVTSEWDFLDEFTNTGSLNSFEDGDGNIYLAYPGCRTRDACRATVSAYHAWLAKIDRYGTLLWLRDQGGTRGSGGVLPTLAPLTNGRMAYGWTRDTFDLRLQESPPNVYILDSLGHKRDSIEFRGSFKTLVRLIPARNGDVIGVGSARTMHGLAGWMFRISCEGELKWERLILDHRLSDETDMDFLDVSEAEDGSIAASGALTRFDVYDDVPNRRYEDGSRGLYSMIVKLDANGCYEAGCSSDTIFLGRTVSTQEVELENQADLNVWPNPVQRTLNLELPPRWLGGTDVWLRYELLGINGQRVLEGKVTNPLLSFSLEGVPTGAYVLRIIRNGRLVGVRQVVKVE